MRLHKCDGPNCDDVHVSRDDEPITNTLQIGCLLAIFVLCSPCLFACVVWAYVLIRETIIALW